MTTMHAGGNTSVPGHGEAPPPSATGERNRGGWITTPFIIGRLCSQLRITELVLSFVPPLIFVLTSFFSVHYTESSNFRRTIPGDRWLHRKPDRILDPRIQHKEHRCCAS